MCTKCGVFAHDFAEFYCDCGQKLDFIDVSDIDGLRIWLKHFEHLDEHLMDDHHVCDIGEDCTNEDCIDCAERCWEIDDDSYDEGFYATYHESYHESDCIDHVKCMFLSDDEDDFEDCDSVS
jgi:hypothetical protein